jgi:hypothetical protein
MVISFKMLFQVMNLRMAVVTRRNAVIRSGFRHLLKFQATIVTPGFRKAGLQKSATAATTKVIGSVGCHVDKVFFSHNGSDDEPEILGYGIPQRLSHQLAGILDREFYPTFLVPVRRNVELSFSNPLGVIFDDALDFKIVFDIKFGQSDPD